MTSEALNGVIELIKQWSDQASLSTDNFDLQALRSAMTTTQIPAPENIEIEKVNIGGVSAEWILGPDAKHDQRLLYLHGGFYYNISQNLSDE